MYKSLAEMFALFSGTEIPPRRWNGMNVVGSRASLRASPRARALVQFVFIRRHPPMQILIVAAMYFFGASTTDRADTSLCLLSIYSRGFEFARALTVTFINCEIQPVPSTGAPSPLSVSTAEMG